MNWRLSIAVSALVAVSVTAVILASVLFVSWRLAVAREVAELDTSADRMLQRAEAIYEEASTTLQGLVESDASPCSPEQILLMKRATQDELFIDNVAFASGGFVRCNAYGPVESVISSEGVDVVHEDGISLNVNWIGAAPPPRPILVVKLEGYRVLVDQRSFYDDLLSPGAIQNFTLRTPNGIPIASGRDDASMVYATSDGQEMVSEQRSQHWIVNVHAPSLGFLQHVESLATFVIPFAVILATLIGGGLIWLLLRPISAKALIERALRYRQFIVHYQPIIELETQRCVGAEALVRLRRADGILVRPDLFIPYAEESGLIQPLTDYVIDSVVREMGDLLRNDRSMHISINISPVDIVSGRIVAALHRALEGTGIEPAQIWLEVTERGFVDIHRARTALEELRSRGHCIAIDDFGTGYSGLHYLQQLPVEMIKIDKSFIDTVGTTAPTNRVTGHIISMARELKLWLVAEGVETEAQAAYLREQNVEYAQGWLFARAISAAEFLAFVKANRHQRDRATRVAALGAA